MPAYANIYEDRHVTPQLSSNTASPQVSEQIKRAVECYVQNAGNGSNVSNHMSSSNTYDIRASMEEIRATPAQLVAAAYEQQERKSQNTTECVSVPSSEHVAEIVGRQGCKIKALRAKTNTYIKTPVRGDEPCFVVTGRKEDVMHAKREILSAAEHFSQIRACRKNNLNGAMAPGPPISTPGQVTKEVRVPYRVVGLVVGPKGATIKRIQQSTRTYIVTPSRDKDPVFEVTGMPENVDHARREIESHIALRTGGLNENDDVMPPMNMGSSLVAAVSRGAYDNLDKTKCDIFRQLLPSTNGFNNGTPYENVLNRHTPEFAGSVSEALGSLSLMDKLDERINEANSFGYRQPTLEESFLEFSRLRNKCKSPTMNSILECVGLIDEGLGSSNGSSPSFTTTKTSSIWGDIAAPSHRSNGAVQPTLQFGDHARRGSAGSALTPPTARASPSLGGTIDNDYRFTSALPFSLATLSATGRDSDEINIMSNESSRKAPGCGGSTPPSSPDDRTLVRPNSEEKN